MIKIVAPSMARKVMDWGIKVYGGAGVSDDTPLAMMWAHQRTLRLADGPDDDFKFVRELDLDLAPGQVLFVDFSASAGGLVVSRG